MATSAFAQNQSLKQQYVVCKKKKKKKIIIVYSILGSRQGSKQGLDMYNRLSILMSIFGVNKEKHAKSMWQMLRRYT